ncbi:enoyl-CoA hydratase/isomerase family protein [Limnoglobus roseus]|uniref:Enoyl-CoA hydratase/isomerase family protein n=1 Tax=Limnoglobus roseus TaxID=2598579 RepID=A0A5C1A9B7_9BACT|nr:enoyl-CoA hydratase/isomerase family protein [Limnoglobus roseus]QEL15959.1 enoyl-CoA hydratase/isomerase family protein [Limnoglobus roseus]
MMLFETDTVWVEAANRVATLWLNCPGTRLNAARIAEVGQAVEIVRTNPFLEILVVRSARPTAFCTGFEPEVFATEADAHEYATAGRRVLKQLAELPIPTLAFIDGPCHAAGLELALACDYRLAVATPDATLSHGESPCWGGTARLRNLIGRDSIGTLTAREAKAAGLVDHAFCRRRAKVELRTFLDRLEDRPRKRRQPWFGWRRTLRLDAEELAAFLKIRRVGTGDVRTHSPCDGTVIELRNCPQAVPFAAEYALRGGTVVTNYPAAVHERLAEPWARGRATPLELEQARGRVRTTGPAKLVLESESAEPLAIVRATLAPYRQAVRVGFPVLAESTAVELTGGAASASVAGVLAAAGFTPVVVDNAPKLAVRPLLAAVWDEAVRLVAEGFPIDLIDDASGVVSLAPLLRSLDAVGSDTAMSLVPRLRPFAEAGLREVFYHADRPREANALAQLLLSPGPRLMTNEEPDERECDVMRTEIEARLTGRLRAELEGVGEGGQRVAVTAGLILPEILPPAGERFSRRRVA